MSMYNTSIKIWMWTNHKKHYFDILIDFEFCKWHQKKKKLLSLVLLQFVDEKRNSKILFLFFFPVHNMKLMVHISCHRGISTKMSNCHTGIRINHVDIFILSHQNKVWQNFCSKNAKNNKKGTQRILFQFNFLSYH